MKNCSRLYIHLGVGKQVLRVNKRLLRVGKRELRVGEEY